MAKFTLTQTPNSRFAYLYPTANGCELNCFPFGDSSNYLCVDDVYDSLIPDNTYVFMDGPSTVSDLYAMENHGTLSGTINYVKGCCRAKSDLFAPAHNFKYKIVLSRTSDCTDFATSGIQNLSTGFTTFEYAWKTNPFTSAAWTWNNIDNLQLGFEASSPSVVVSPFIMLPTADGDRTDIGDVTTGYSHWEAVRAERPLTEVYEDGAAWKYDLYEYVMASAAYYAADCYSMIKVGDYVVSTDNVNGKSYISAWNNGRVQYLDDVAIGGYIIIGQGTKFYVGAFDRIYVLSYDSDSQTLSKIQEINLPGGGDAQDLKIQGDYLYASCGPDSLRVYSISATTGEITYITNNGKFSNGVCFDNDYIYSVGSNKIQAYSFDGSNLNEIDEVAANGQQFTCDTDGNGNIFVPCGTSGLRVFSFDGVNLSLDDTQDDGGHYSRLAYQEGYIHVGDAQTPTQGLRAYTYTGGNLALAGTYADVDTPARGVHAVDGFIFTKNASDEGIILAFNGSSYYLVRNVANGMLSRYLDDNIESVSVLSKMGKEYDADDGADIRGRMNIKTHGTEYQSDYWTLEYPKKWYANTWSTNPNTGAAWTLAEVKALQAGIGLYGTGSKYAACNICQIAIAATTNISPQIQTSQVYLKINYTPPTSTCTLTRPKEISFDHNRNIQMLNFWSGDREVYDESRANKTVVLTGREIANGCSTIACVRTMGENGAVITLSSEVGWGTGFIDTTYRIKSFGWKHVSEKPDVWDWILELEANT